MSYRNSKESRVSRSAVLFLCLTMALLLHQVPTMTPGRWVTLSVSLLGTQRSLWGMSCAQVCQQDVLPRAICVPALPFDWAELGGSTGGRLQTSRMKGHGKKKKIPTASCWKWGNVWKRDRTNGQADTKPAPRYMRVTKTSIIACSGWTVQGQRSFARLF